MESQDKRLVVADEADSSVLGLERKSRYRRDYSHRATRWLRWAAMLLLFLSMAHASTPSPPDNTYVYDGNGRLVAVTRADGTSAQYVYDAMGNLVQVTAVPASQLTIFGFNPVHGAVGASVTIYGQGFSGTAANDAVTFNGTAATVTSATANQLVAMVPTGATTGLISVTTGGNTAESSSSFVVDGTGIPPAIVQATPAVVSVGGAVTVTGTQLDPVAGQTSVQMGGRDISPSSVAASQIQFTVPSNANSGFVTAETAYGQAVSPAPVFVLPSSISPANLVSSGVGQLNGAPVNLNIGSAGQDGAVVFSVTSNNWISLQLSSITTTASSISYTIYGPSNAVIQQGSVSTMSPSIHLPYLASGTYMAIFQPNTAGAQLAVGVEVNATVTSAAPLSITAAFPWESKRLLFQATQGQNMELTLNNVSVPGATYNEFYVSVYNATGSSIASFYCYQSNPGSSCMQHLWYLPAGTYNLVVSPTYGGTLQFNTLVQPDIVGPLIAENGSASIALNAGQVERFTFNANQGDTVALQASSVTTTPAGQSMYFYVYRPDAGAITSSTPAYTSFSSSATQLVNLSNLPVTGTYTVIAVPNYGLPASAQLSYVSGVTGALSTNGASQSYSGNAGGEAVYLSFNATQGQNLELTLNNISITGTGTYLYVNVYNASNSNIASYNCYQSNPGASCSKSLWNLPAGAYQVVVSPAVATDVMHFNTLLEADTAGGALTAGTPATINLAAGQAERFTFSGTLGTTMALQLSGVSTTPTGQYVYINVYRPDAGQIATNNYYTYTYSGSGPATLNLSNLPATGTYTVVAYTSYGLPAAGTLTLVNGVTGTLTANGTSQSYAASEAGQNVYMSFNATQGQNLELTMNNISITGGGSYYNVNVYNATGGNVGSSNCYASYPGASCTLSLWNLTAGTYSIVASPANSTDTIHFNTLLETDVASGALTANTAAAVNLAAGQAERFTFSGSVGGTVGLELTGVTTTPAGQNVYIKVYRPDAGQITTSDYYTYTYTTSGPTTLNLSNLPVSGTYTVVAYTSYGLPATASLTLASGDTGTLTANGASQSYSANAAGENAYLSFTATQGQNLELTMNNISITGTGTYYSVNVYNATGGNVTSQTCYVSNPGASCTLSLWNLPAGKYSVVATPENAGDVIHFSALLESDVAGGSLTVGTAASVNLAAGQAERFTFSGTLGGTVALQLNGVTTTPTGQYVYIKVYRPDVGQITTSDYYTYTYTGSGPATLNLSNLPASGTYTVVAYTAYGLPATGTLTLFNGDTGTLPTTGASQAYVANTAGENAYMSFTATQGQNLELTMNNIVITGTGTYYSVNVYNVTGNSVGSQTCYTSNPGPSCTLSLWNLPAGTYSIVVSPEYGGDKLSFSAILEADVVGPALTTGTLANITLAAGQTERVTFTGTVGGSVSLQLSGVTTTPAGQYVYVKVYRPDVGQITTSDYYTYTYSTGSTATLNLTNLPAAGTYTAVVYNNYGLPATASLTELSSVAGAPPTYGTATLPVNGASQSEQSAAAGQNVTMTFNATQGQNLELTLNNVTVTGGTYFSVAVTNASGANVGNFTCYPTNPGASCSGSLWNLIAGTYTVVATANSGVALKFNALLESDISGGALTAGTPANINLAAGQVERFSFNGTLGGTVALQLNGVTTTPTGQYMYITVYRPDAGSITGSNYYTYTYTGSGPTTLNLSNLPVSGTYTVIAYDLYGLPATGTLTLANGSTGTQPTNGTSESYAANETGQNVYMSFTATQGQNLELTLNNASVTGGTYNQFYVEVYSASGNNVVNFYCYASNPGASCTQSLWNLAAGTYTVTAVPTYGGVIKFNALLEPDVSGGALTAGTAANINLAAGQAERFTFSGTVGGTVALQLNAVTTTPTGQDVYINVYRPDGGLITTSDYYTYTYTGSGPTTLNLSNLPASGTYTVVAYTSYGVPATGTLTLATGATGTQTINGTSQSFAATEADQNVYVSFTATQGQNLELTLNNASVTGGTYNQFYVEVYNPSGGNVVNFYCNASNPGASCTQPLWNLAAGKYSVIAIPTYGGVIKFNALVESDVSGGALTAGTAANINLAAGQAERFTFSGTAGGTLALQLTGVTTTPTGQNVYINVYRPDVGLMNSSNYYTYTYTGTGPTTLNLSNLPVSGTYTVVAYTSYGLPATGTLTLASGNTGTLTVNGSAQSYTATEAGQNIYMSFTATQGQNLELTLNNTNVTGATYNQFYVQIYNAAGGNVANFWCYPTNPNGTCNQSLWNLAAGKYTVIAEPSYGGVIQLSALLEADAAGGALTAGTPANVNLAIGQPERFTFSGTVGETVALQLSNVTTTPTGQSVYVEVYRPDAGLITTSNYYTNTSSGGGPATLNLSNLPVSGTYTVVVYAGYDFPAAATLTLASGNTGTLATTGTSQSYTANETGEDVYMSFAATQGQNLQLTINNIVITGTGTYFTVNVYNASGGNVGYVYCYPSNGPSCTLSLWNLPVGNYSIVISPQSAADKLSFNAILNPDVVGGALVEGTPSSFSLTAGQVERFTFNGTVGGSATLQLTGTTTPSGTNVYVNIYRPDTGLVTTNGYYTYTYSSGSAAPVTLYNLPATGTYTAVVYNGYGLPMTGQLLWQ